MVRRARRLGFGKDAGSYADEELELLAAWIVVIEAGPCSYCHEHHPGMHLDHIQPLVYSLDWRWTNSAPACPFCNLSKGHRPWWLAYMRLTRAPAREV